ncbi:MAG: peroxiredoxin-like family protein [Acidimicrobiales bacterium]
MSRDLEEALRERYEASRSRTPEDRRAIMDSATDQLRESGLADRAINVGQVAPTFALPNAAGKIVDSADLLVRGPLVVSFYRGGWCPYCSIELRMLQTRLDELNALGATLVAISPQTPDNSLTTEEKLELSFPVLSDVGNVVARRFGLVFQLPEALREVYNGFGIDLPAANGDDTFELPIPATFVIDGDGVVAWRHVDPDYTKRAEPDDVIAAVEALAVRD